MVSRNIDRWQDLVHVNSLYQARWKIHLQIPINRNFILFSGDILVFLTGQDEIESLAKLITDCAQHCGPGKISKNSYYCPQYILIIYHW